jgi:hypothetical protein
LLLELSEIGSGLLNGSVGALDLNAELSDG